MKLTLIQPCVGRRPGQKYLKGWQMEPLPLATIAGLTPPGVDIACHDDRMERIPFDEPTDLVAMSVETYTARRAYQIASDYRRRGVPVVMGGFHATLCPDEVAQYAESVVIGEAETVWEDVLRDAERGTLQTYYHSPHRPSLADLRPDRSIYAGKRYLPLALVEAARGCRYRCEFCAIQAFSDGTQSTRPAHEIVAEVERIRHKPVVFFVDDNFALDKAHAKNLLRELIPLNIRWVGQTSLEVAHDEELLHLMAASGCQGVLIGLESVNPSNLRNMGKSFTMQHGGVERALANLKRFKIRLYTTFVFGYDGDTEASFQETLEFARRHQFYVAAFNHLVPFPGTPLYRRLNREGRLLYDRWWLDQDYGFYMVAFQPAHMTAERLERGCIEARKAYYRWGSIWQRSRHPVNRTDALIGLAFFGINFLFRKEVVQRHHLPLGDKGWPGELIRVRTFCPPPPSGTGKE